MNIQLSSRSDLWYSPLEVLVMVRSVLGTIDLDPASDANANDRVAAVRYFDEHDDGLLQDWGNNLSIYLNPPGGKVLNQSKAILFWKKLMDTKIKHAIYMGFSLEHLQSSQGKGVKSIGEFPFCIPKKRLQFHYPNDPSKASPSHSNVIVYVPGTIDRTDLFYDVFKTLGTVVNV